MQDDNETRLAGVVRDLNGRFPEFWMLAVSAVVWVALALRTGAHIHHAGIAGNWWHWMMMVAAMMLPLQIQAVRWTAERSLWPRRHRAILGFLIGYLGLWAIVGAVFSWVATVYAIPHRIGWMQGAAVGLLIETLWLLSPWKRFAAHMCHRALPLSPAGWRADRDCLAYGWTIGYGCALNCWPLMLLCWLAGHTFPVIVLGFGVACVDRYVTADYRLCATATAIVGSALGVVSWVR